MTMKAFYDWQTNGGGGDVTRLIGVLERLEVSWCVIGGLAVNHWAAEPVVTADVDIVIALEKVEDVVKALIKEGFAAEHFPWSINLKGRSNVSIQISTEERYRAYPERSIPCDIWGILMRVASLEDTLNGKLAAYADKTRRPSKRQKDLLDILRLVESHPSLLSSVPEAIRGSPAFQNA
jgi:hypothetical protein